MRLFVSGSTQKFAELRHEYADVLGSLLSPACGNRVESLLKHGLPWGADNSAFHNFDAERFRVFMGKIALQPGCVFLAVPDVVADARKTLEQFHAWALECRTTGQPLALVAQDGLETLDVPWGLFEALFIGGSTRWKESQHAADLSMEAKRRGKYLHVGRVNSKRRMRMCLLWGADSIDGTGMSRFGDKHLGKLLRWRRELERELAIPTLFA